MQLPVVLNSYAKQALATERVCVWLQGYTREVPRHGECIIGRRMELDRK